MPSRDEDEPEFLEYHVSDASVFLLSSFFNLRAVNKLILSNHVSLLQLPMSWAAVKTLRCNITLCPHVKPHPKYPHVLNDAIPTRIS